MHGHGSLHVEHRWLQVAAADVDANEAGEASVLSAQYRRRWAAWKGLDEDGQRIMAFMNRPNPDAHPPDAASPTGVKNHVSPKKLLLSKWTAVTPQHKEKHFVVIRVIEPEPPDVRIETVELEAIHSRRSFMLPWRELTDGGRWRQGWV